MLKAVLLTAVFLFVPGLSAQLYEDKRCRCLCPDLAEILNLTGMEYQQTLFVAYVPPNECTCDYVILPKFGDAVKGFEQEICTKCECKYEMRNTTIIFIVVILVMWMTTLLSMYMIFLTCLNPFMLRKRLAEQNTNSTDEVQKLLAIDDDNDE